MTEKPSHQIISKEDLKKQAQLPDTDLIGANPESIDGLIEEMLQAKSKKSYFKDIVINLVASAIFALLVFLTSMFWEKINAEVVHAIPPAPLSHPDSPVSIQFHK